MESLVLFFFLFTANFYSNFNLLIVGKKLKKNLYEKCHNFLRYYRTRSKFNRRLNNYNLYKILNNRKKLKTIQCNIVPIRYRYACLVKMLCGTIRRRSVACN